MTHRGLLDGNLTNKVISHGLCSIEREFLDGNLAKSYSKNKKVVKSKWGNFKKENLYLFKEKPVLLYASLLTLLSPRINHSFCSQRDHHCNLAKVRLKVLNSET